MPRHNNPDKSVFSDNIMIPGKGARFTPVFKIMSYEGTYQEAVKFHDVQP